jgi:hypothetical protein
MSFPTFYCRVVYSACHPHEIASGYKHWILFFIKISVLVAFFVIANGPRAESTTTRQRALWDKQRKWSGSCLERNKATAAHSIFVERCISTLVWYGVIGSYRATSATTVCLVKRKIKYVEGLEFDLVICYLLIGPVQTKNTSVSRTPTALRLVLKMKTRFWSTGPQSG